MSDGLTNMRSQPDYACSECGFVGAENHFYKTYGDEPIVCLKCYAKSTCSTLKKPSKEKGIKFDDGKLQYSLIPPEIKLYLAEILTFGAKKYAPNNWKKVDVQRYYDAFERHMTAFQLGEENDQESGMHHLKHALTNMVFITWLELNKLKG